MPRRGTSFSARSSAIRRAGGASVAAPSPRLPSAQERVQQAYERAALFGGVESEAGGWNPPDLGWPQERALFSRRARIVGKSTVARKGILPRSRFRQLKELERLRIAAPRFALFCAQRKVRREVLFALRRSGRINPRSPGRGGRYLRRAESSYRC